MSKAESKMGVTFAKLCASVVLITAASFLNNAFGATIVSSNTTWTGEIVLDDNVEVASGAVLTIAAGTIVRGGSIGVQGSLIIEGRKDSLVYLGGISWIDPPRGAKAPVIEIKYADFYGISSSSAGGILSITNSIIHGPLFTGDGGPVSITDSVIWSTVRIYNPKGANVLRGNKFGPLIEVIVQNRNGASIVIENNYFEGGGVYVYGNGNTADDIRVVNNSFMLPDNPSDYLGPDSPYVTGEKPIGEIYPALAIAQRVSAGMNAVGNYFGTTEVSEIETRIVDANDSLSLEVRIPFLPILEDHHPDTPANRPPVISIGGGDRTLSDTDGVAGELVTLTATAVDSDGDIVSTKWYLNGEEIATGLNARLKLSNGTSDIVFRASDNDGAVAEALLAITVTPPTYLPSDGWLTPYNGVSSPLELDLSVNNIGLYDVASGSIDSCMRINTGGALDSIEGESFFDIRFNVSNSDEGLIRVAQTRAFNATGALNEYGEAPHCSGAYETTTGVYMDIMQVKWNVELLGRTVEVIRYFSVQFEMMDSATLTLRITNSEELGLL